MDNWLEPAIALHLVDETDSGSLLELVALKSANTKSVRVTKTSTSSAI